MGTGWDEHMRLYESVSGMVGGRSEPIGGMEAGRLAAQLTESPRG
jgi:hypothetical protein